MGDASGRPAATHPQYWSASAQVGKRVDAGGENSSILTGGQAPCRFSSCSREHREDRHGSTISLVSAGKEGFKLTSQSFCQASALRPVRTLWYKPLSLEDSNILTRTFDGGPADKGVIAGGRGISKAWVFGRPSASDAIHACPARALGLAHGQTRAWERRTRQRAQWTRRACPSSRLMTFASFDKPEVQQAIRLLADADKLAVFVGAGISAEAGLPRWPLLVERLLTRASNGDTHFRNNAQMEAWVARTLRTELLPGAAGIAETLFDDEHQLAKALRAELYRPPVKDARTLRPADFFPGPTAHAVAALRIARDKRFRGTVMKILTTNYDNLLEQAFSHRRDTTAQVMPWYWPEPNKKLPRDRIKVHHLHGYLISNRPQGTLVLTDGSYHEQSPATITRDHFVREILSNYSCLFLGSSFSDPNIIRYIRESAGERRARTSGGENPASEQPQHVALFTHHSDDPQEILAVREDVIKRRLADSFTMCVFLDYYADVSQFVYEVSNAVKSDAQQAYHRRARNLLRPILRRVICTGNRAKFNAAQPVLNRRLCEILSRVVREVDETHGSELKHEDLAMALWLLDESGRHLAPWVATDRVHRDPRLIQSVELRPQSRWLAVRAVCEGKWLKEPREREQSRWRFIAGLPLLAAEGEADGYVIIGAVTITSQHPEDTTWLNRIDSVTEDTMAKEFSRRIGSWLMTAART